MNGDDFLKELGEPSRRAIIALLRIRPHSVQEIVSETGFKQPNVSNQLARMRASGFVRAEKKGRQVFYHLSSPEIAALMETAMHGDEPSHEPISLEQTAQAFLEQALEGREEAARSIVEKLLQSRAPMLDIYEQVFRMSLIKIGDWYRLGVIDVAQEHLATSLTERMMARVAHYYTPVTSPDRTALFGCVAGNLHDVGIRMVSDVLRCLNWRTLFLGANVPTDDFVRSVKVHQPELVGVSCALPETESEAARLVNRLQQLKTEDHNKPFLIALGGLLPNEYPERALKINADITVRSLGEFIQVLPEKLMKTTQPILSE